MELAPTNAKSPTFTCPHKTADAAIWAKFPTLHPCSTKAFEFIIAALPILASALTIAPFPINTPSFICADFETIADGSIITGRLNPIFFKLKFL